MSYDLSLFKQVPGLDAVILSEHEDKCAAFTPNELKAASDAVKSALPQLEAYGDDEACFYELTDDETGLQIGLDTHSLSISIPYWHEDADAHALFDHINTAMRAINSAVAIVAFDPQLGREINPAQGLTREEATYYSRTTTHVQEIMSSSDSSGSVYPAYEAAAAPKPWWKFW